MKTFKRLLLLLVLSLIIATGLFFVNSNVIITSFSNKVAEIVFLAIPVFIIVLIMYLVNKALVKSVKSIKNKKPSGGEGLNR
jgi:hypothetical protein